MHKQLLKIITIITTLVLFVTLFVVSFQKKIEIVKVGEIPKAFTPKTTKLTIDSPKQKPKRENAIHSVVSENTVYLTFDDGPSNITDDVLNVLKEENVAATFFVTGRHIDQYQSIVRRAYQEGHTIALHSYTHTYSYVYQNEDNYFDDLNEIGNKVYQITGQHSRIVRLPGGSSNTVSIKYNQGVITRITEKLSQKDYYYFDWNVDSKDASGKISADQIVHNVTSFLRPGENIVLMHDTAAKATTLEALPNMIKNIKAQGYTFSRITKDTAANHHHINN